MSKFPGCLVAIHGTILEQYQLMTKLGVVSGVAWRRQNFVVLKLPQAGHGGFWRLGRFTSLRDLRQKVGVW